jgi:hypothetical protein
MKKVIWIIILLTIVLGFYYYIKNENKPIAKVEDNNFLKEEVIVNGIIDGEKFDNGFRFDDCPEGTNCVFPDNRFQTSISLLLIDDLDNDSENEILVTISKAAGNNFGTPIVLQLEQLGENEFETIKSTPLNDKGEFEIVSFEDGKLVLSIDTSWKGGSLIEQTIFID